MNMKKGKRNKNDDSVGPSATADAPSKKKKRKLNFTHSQIPSPRQSKIRPTRAKGASDSTRACSFGGIELRAASVMLVSAFFGSVACDFVS